MGDRTYFPELDGLRAVAILLVLLGHTMAGTLTVAGPWHRLGGFGVMLFFQLSGFLITGVLIASAEENGRIDLREFYVRRALRIFPAAYTFLAFVALAVALGWVTDVSWRGLAIAALYLRNIAGHDVTLGHLWSLSIEEQFYLVWPPVLAFVGWRKALPLAVLSTIGFAAFRTISIAGGLLPYGTGFFYERPWFRFDSLLIGCCFALLRSTSPVAWRRLLTITRSVASPLWTVPAALAWTYWAEDQPWAHSLYLSVQLVLGALLLLRSFSPPEPTKKNILTNPGLRTIGRLSYSLYLWQQIFLVTTAPSWGWLRRFPVNLILTAAAAYASYTFIEKPCLRLKDSKALRTWLALKRGVAADPAFK